MRPDVTTCHTLFLLVLTVTASCTASHAQTTHLPWITAQPMLTELSSSNDSGLISGLPEAPSPTAEPAGQAGTVTVEKGNSQITPKYNLVVFSDQSALPFGASDKIKYGLVRSVQPINILSWTIPSAFSQAVNSAPHYGEGWGPYGQRYGAAAARGTMQTIATDSIFAPIFHQDPRFYELGPQHSFAARAIYAASRAVVTRTDSGKQAVNVSLLAGYVVTAAATNAFYPQRDRSASQTFQSYGGSVGGAALSFVFNEFLDDGMRLAHLRK